MRTFGTDSPEFMAFKLAGRDETYKLPLASSMPMSVLIELSDAAAKGGPDVLRCQLDLLRRYLGDVADEMTAAQVADIFTAWNDESTEQGASASE